MSYGIRWEAEAIDRLSALAKDYPEAPDLLTHAAYELVENPRPTNSSQLGTSSFRRLLLGFWRVTYKVVEADHTIVIIMVGRSTNPR